MPKPQTPRKLKPPVPRFSIAEWYGHPLETLSGDERRRLAQRQFLKKKDRLALPCPFRPGTNCWKESGVCTLRLYRLDKETGVVEPVEGPLGELRTTCPSRFEEDGMIYRWVGEKMLDCPDVQVLGQVGFLDPPLVEDGSRKSDREVGRIDNILFVPASRPFSWCALEIQSVYFQGEAMSNEFVLLRDQVGDVLPFPAKSHRPDYRSSGPKRLMAQLLVKVPTLRRWGKKMAVLVDRGFFAAMGNMRPVSHISNCDVAWFVVGYEKTETGSFKLAPSDLYLTTLEDSVEGLTAGVPASLDVFEQRILNKLQGPSRPRKITSDE